MEYYSIAVVAVVGCFPLIKFWQTAVAASDERGCFKSNSCPWFASRGNFIKWLHNACNESIEKIVMVLDLKSCTWNYRTTSTFKKSLMQFERTFILVNPSLEDFIRKCSSRQWREQQRKAMKLYGLPVGQAEHRIFLRQQCLGSSRFVQLFQEWPFLFKLLL